MKLHILRALADGMGPADAVTLNRESVRELLEEVGAGGAVPETPSAIPADMTVEDVAERFDKALTTVRDWCRAGKFEGAYLLNGREWRIPVAGVEAFIAAQRSTTAPGWREAS